MPALEPAPQRKRTFVLEPIAETRRASVRFPGHTQTFNRSPSKVNPKGRRIRAPNKRRTPVEGAKRSPCGHDPVTEAAHSREAEGCAGGIGGIEEWPGGFEDQPMLAVEEDEVDADDTYQWFISLVAEGYVGFVRISRTLYMVQGFDLNRKEGTDAWYHFQARPRGTDVQLTCLCPRGNQHCLHKRFYKEFQESRFGDGQEDSEEVSVVGDPQVVLFSRRVVGAEEERIRLCFSVEGDSGTEDARSRAIVTYEGNLSREGRWSCHKDAHVNCSHKRKALALMVRDLQWEGDIDTAGSFEGMYMVDDMNVGQSTERAVSYLPILPPEWAALPTDNILYSRPDPCREIEEVIHIGENSRSACGMHYWQHDKAIVQKSCHVYTLSERLTRKIELQECPSCAPHRQCWIGPDARESGLFNLNNSALFTHELLDEYTNRYTTSETPFVAFVLCISRIYESRGTKFIGEDLFRSAWFAYASLQELENDMWCPDCGTYPESVIWDGVTLAFGKKHIRSSLRPPTEKAPDAPRRRHKRVLEQQWIVIPDEGRSKVRRRLLKWLKRWGRTKACANGENKDNKVGESGDSSEDESNVEGEERWMELDAIVDALKSGGCDSVAILLVNVFGRGSMEMAERAKRRYRILLEQVSREMWQRENIDQQ
ncbi:hypothetical protein VNI00_014814 [Paramarasmius palmivorus]|uniref:HMG domain-containing protein n=1 Tax=Paramarasmius palmivorus TaxID=297713 RepID=A0AAW0BQV6_9AGAR